MPQFSAESPIKVGSYQTSTGFTAVVTDINLEARTPFPVWGVMSGLQPVRPYSGRNSDRNYDLFQTDSRAKRKGGRK